MIRYSTAQIQARQNKRFLDKCLFTESVIQNKNELKRDQNSKLSECNSSKSHYRRPRSR